MVSNDAPSTPQRPSAAQYDAAIQCQIEALEREKLKLLSQFEAVGVKEPYRFIEIEYGCLPPCEVVKKLGLDDCAAKTQELVADVKLAVAMMNDTRAIAEQQAATTFMTRPPDAWEHGVSDRRESWQALEDCDKAAYLEVDIKRVAQQRCIMERDKSKSSWDKRWSKKIARVREVDKELGTKRLRMTPRKLHARLKRAMYVAKNDPSGFKRKAIYYVPPPPAKRKKSMLNFDDECMSDEKLLNVVMPNV